jgi:ABC-type multidrug transport system fused ATPase/permease subunit
MQIIKKLLFLLTPNEHKRAGLLLLMILIMAILDTIGVASILPFIAVLTNPDIIETNFILNNIYQAVGFLGVDSNQKFLLLLGIFVLALLVFSLIFKSLTIYAQARFVEMREYSIGKKLVEGYLHQPYSWFLGRHSADIGKTILSEVQQVILGGIQPMFELIAKGTVVIAIITLLMITDLKLAIIVGFSFSLTYGLIYKYTQKYLKQIGKRRLHNNHSRFKTLSEAFGAAKEVKVGGLEKTYIDKFSNSAFIYAQSQASLKILSQIPRYAIEVMAFGGIMSIILYLMIKFGDFDAALPLVSLYVLAGYRLIPAFQGIYLSFANLTYNLPAIDKLYDDIRSLKPFELNQDQNIMSLKKSISLKDISFNYPDSKQTSLKDININIQAKTTVGLIGPTGSGKTTTVDIILGLLEAQKGTLEIDDQVITKKNIRAWQRSIGYVPQHIYLSDDTISANIAFGISTSEINKESVERAAKIANIHDFIINDLPKKYQTTIGERGIKLSGGQRQRIGIARALYRNPQILILDEATSSLDNLTEQAVIDAVNILSKNITIILIAHRLNTVKNCDIIFKLNKGTLIEQGTYEKLF